MESFARLSPDGRWIVYERTERPGTPGGVFVEPFPTTGGLFQVSAGGGFQPAWSRDGQEIFYIAADNRLMAVSVNTRDGFRAAPAVPLFQVSTMGPGAVGSQYAVSRDGRRILFNVAQQAPLASAANVVVDWPAAVQR
jgi:Tol biopolymer transport system component